MRSTARPASTCAEMHAGFGRGMEAACGVELAGERVFHRALHLLRPCLALRRGRGGGGEPGPVLAAETGEPDIAQHAALDTGVAADAGEREVAAAPGEFHEGGPVAGGEDRDAGLHQKLVLGELGLVEPVEEGPRGDRPPPAPARQHERGVERHRAGRQFGGGVGERDAAAEGAAVADRGMGDMRHGVRDQRQMFGHKRRRQHLGMAGERADPHRPVLQRDAFQRVDAVDVDQEAGLGEPHVQRRHQALAAGEDAGFALMLRKKLQDAVEAFRPDIGEARRLHSLPSLPVCAEAL